MNNLGEEFIWWFGKIEDINDPLQLGRVRVRCYGWYNEDVQEIPTADLPWAQPIQPITSSAQSEIGQSPTGLKIGSWVVGFFMDGNEAQRPMIMGSIAGIPNNTHDVDSRARGINNISKTPDNTIGEPADPYNAQYPDNHTIKTESGHLIELDDTPDNERIHVYHKSGTFIEIHPNGDVVTQHKNGWRSVTGNDKLHITVDFDIVVDGDCNWTTNGSVNWHVTGNYQRTVEGASHLRYNGDKWEHIGADTYSRHEEGTDYSCPTDPPRTSDNSCDDVNSV